MVRERPLGVPSDTETTEFEYFGNDKDHFRLPGVGGMRLECCHSLKTLKTVNEDKMRSARGLTQVSRDSNPHHVMKQMRLFDVNMPACSI